MVIGQRNGLSYGDRQTVAKIYERFFSKGYAGVWRAGSGRYGLWANAAWNDFSGEWQAWSADGLRLVDIHVQPTRQGLRYSGVFSEGTGGHGLWVDAPWESFVAKWQEWSGRGLRLHDVFVRSVNGQDRYTGVFLEGGGGHGLWANVTWESFAAKWQELGGQGLRLIDFEIVNPAAGAIFDGVDVGESALPMAEEPFGGILAAMEPAAARVPEQAEGYGAAQFDGQPAPTGAALATAQGGAVLPNIVAPRDTDAGVRGGLVSSGARDGTATEASGYGGATFG
ncbi:MAG: peptidase family protein [Blastococcus sp.]|nr:peptidase family protein [Blastococcus sp.]